MILTDSTDYVVRSTRAGINGRVSYEVVDLGGTIAWVTVPRPLSTPERVDAIIRARLAARRRVVRPAR